MWDTEMVVLLRSMIDDWEAPFTYSDERLQRNILLSAQFVSRELNISTAYDVDIEQGTVSPDFTDRDAGTRNPDFMNLVLLKSGCFIEAAEAKLAAGQAITIRDQGSMISLGGTGGVLDGKIKVWQNGYCKQYQEAKDNFLMTGGTGIGAGVIVSGPLPGIAGPYYEGYR